MARSLESMHSCFPFISCTSVSSLVTLSWRIFMSSLFSVDTWGWKRVSGGPGVGPAPMLQLGPKESGEA